MNRSWERASSPALRIVQQFLESFEEYPSRQASLDFDTDAMVEQMMDLQSR